MAVAKMAGRTVRVLELAGWGGGPGMQFSIVIHGLMTVTEDPMFPGLLRATTIALIITEDEFLAKRLIVSPKERLVDTGRKMVGLYDIPKGTSFSFAPNHVRMMVEA